MLLVLVVCAGVVVAVLYGLNREAFGDPIVPDQITRLFDKSDPSLPPGLNYELSVLDPDSQAPMPALPQLGTVEVRLAISNDSALPIVMKFPTSLQCEFIVRRIYTFLGNLFEIPLEVWRSSYFHNYTKRPSTLILKPGETKVYISYWTINNLNQSQVPPGDYRVYTSMRGIRYIEIPKPL
jgi:hypothetical protein